MSAADTAECLEISEEKPGGLERGSRGKPLARIILQTSIGKTCKHVAEVAREIPPDSRHTGHGRLSSRAHLDLKT